MILTDVNIFLTLLFRTNIFEYIVVCVRSDGDYVALQGIWGIQHTADENFWGLVKIKFKLIMCSGFC